MGICKLDNQWKVDGVAIYTPSAKTEIIHDSLADSDSGRTEDGIMHIAWVRRDIVKISMVYPAMTKEELKYIMDKVQGKVFAFTYPDPVLGLRTINCYTSNHSYEYYSDAVYGGLFTNVTFSVIEM